MSVRLERGSAEYYSRTTSLPATTGFTVTHWFRASSLHTFDGQWAFAEAFNGDQSDTCTPYGASSGEIRFYDARAGSFVDDSILTITTNKWYFLGIRVGATQNLIVWGDETGPLGNLTQNPTGTRVAFAAHAIGSTDLPGSGEQFDGEIEGFRIFAAELTQAEIEAEMAASSPVGGHAQHAYYQFLTAQTNDESGNSRTLTANGTPSNGATSPTYPSSGVTGTVSATLAAMTASAAATVALAGAAAVTLAALTTAATGTVALAGAASPTLAAVTTSAAGTVALTGAASVTLGAVTLSAAGAVALVGTTSSTLGAVTSSAAGAVALAGSLSATLAAVTLSGEGAGVDTKPLITGVSFDSPTVLRVEGLRL